MAAGTNSKFHLDKNKGCIAPCHVDETNPRSTGCPHGGPVNHFSSVKEAKKAYEDFKKSKEINTIKKGAQSSTKDQELPQPNNTPNATPAPAQKAEQKKNSAKKAPAAKSKAAQIKEIDDKWASYKENNELAASGKITNEQAEEHINKDRYNSVLMANILTSPSKDLTLETRIKAANNLSGAHFKEEIIDRLGKNVSLIYDHLTDENKVGLSKHVKDKVTQEKIYQDIKKEPNGFHANYMANFMWENPHVDPQIKDAIASQNNIAYSRKKLDNAKKEDIDGYNNIIKSKNNSSNYYSKNETYSLDKDYVTKHGLTSADIDTMFRYEKGNYLFGTNYDDKTGVYSGYRD